MRNRASFAVVAGASFFCIALSTQPRGVVTAAAVALPMVAQDPGVDRGRVLFDRAFSRVDGVGGPGMNSDSCRSCHQDPMMGGAGPLELNVSRFGRDEGGAGPFSDLPGGQGLSKLFPPHTPGREEYDEATADTFEQRQTPSILGDGLIDTILDSTIIANEDPTDADSDGIFGVARRLSINSIIEIGKFGWKAQVPKLGDFVNDAMFGELGITTPDDGRGFGMRMDGDGAADPELSTSQVDDIAAFLSSLPAPERGGSLDPQVAIGEALFDTIGCATCHIPELAGSGGPVRLYSNLLLHNVMPAGFRGMMEPGAGVGFFKTPPLWGIKDTAPYMHDGRAEDLQGAILHHDGEAATVRLRFEALSPIDMEALLLFLEDL